MTAVETGIPSLKVQKSGGTVTGNQSRFYSFVGFEYSSVFKQA